MKNITQLVNIKLFVHQNNNTINSKKKLKSQPDKMLALLLGIASASLSEDYNNNPDLYYRILFEI